MMIATAYLAAASAMNCQVVNADVIRMQDLAIAEPVFSGADPQIPVGYSPLPGAVHIFTAAEIGRLAKTYLLEQGEFRSVCFQREMRNLDPQELHDVLNRVLDIPAARLDVIDYSRAPVPAGDLVFPRSGLALTFTPNADPLLWKGYVVYGSGRHFNIWARVRIHVRLKRVVATDNLITSVPVREDQVRLEILDGVPDVLAPAQSLEQVVGKQLLRPVRRGSSVSLDDLSTALTIHRGDKVDVEFESAGMRLRFQAAAEMDGRYGDRIRLRNLQSNNIFEAEVSGKDQARVALRSNSDQPDDHLHAARDTGGASQKEIEGRH